MADKEDRENTPAGLKGSTKVTNDEDVPSNQYVLNVAFISFFGFMMVQAVFAIIAQSQAMLADCEAMGVDAMTYLFNMLAERVKNRPVTDKELKMTLAERHRKRKLIRLWMELVPPLASVLTLIAVTIVTMEEALGTLFPSEEGDISEDDEPSVNLMLLFSGLNLALDVVNVTCFARAHQAFGLSEAVPMQFSVRGSTSQASLVREALADENVELLHVPGDSRNYDSIEVGPPASDKLQNFYKTASTDDVAPSDADSDTDKALGFNLNMCSAWTHVCADTLRSIAVLVAATIAFFFDSVDGGTADSVAALIVSFIIIVSLIPLLEGLFITAHELWRLYRDPNKSSTTSFEAAEEALVV